MTSIFANDQLRGRRLRGRQADAASSPLAPQAFIGTGDARARQASVWSGGMKLRTSWIVQTVVKVK